MLPSTEFILVVFLLVVALLVLTYEMVTANIAVVSCQKSYHKVRHRSSSKSNVIIDRIPTFIIFLLCAFRLFFR